MAVPEFILDADITLDPALLREVPEIEAAMLGARLERGNRVGLWICVAEREQRRREDKDALDIHRLLQATETTALVATVKTLLQTEVAHDVMREGLAILNEHFTDARVRSSAHSTPTSSDSRTSPTLR